MFQQICAVVGVVAIAAIASSIAGESKYKSKTAERRAAMKKLREEGHDWRQITLIINKMNFRNREGKEFAESELREEFAWMIANEECDSDD